MSVNLAPKCTRNIAPNHEAHLLLMRLIDRTGLRKVEFLARLAEYGHCISDDTFTNWGRPGRSFPRDWPLLLAILHIVSDARLKHRCPASEAIRFLCLTGLPFSELRLFAEIFPAEEFAQALMPYLPERLVERIASSTQSLSASWGCEAE